MWTLYDILIEGIPAKERVDEVICGSHWTMVRSGDRAGVAMTLSDTTRPKLIALPYEGISLRRLAACAKSWNLAEATVGVAALNAYWNSPRHRHVAQALDHEDIEAFSSYRQHVTGKKVAVIGHFPHLEKTIGDVCDLSILERRPSPGDYPDPACEYILPAQAYVFMTGVTLINKTMPRLLQLARGAKIVLVGPSVPLSPLFFQQGVYDLQGFVVTDPVLCRTVLRGEDNRAVFQAGKRISLMHTNIAPLVNA